jgi:hypothetical protein
MAQKAKLPVAHIIREDPQVRVERRVYPIVIAYNHIRFRLQNRIRNPICAPVDTAIDRLLDA